MNTKESEMDRSFFRSLSANRTYRLRAIKVVEYQEAWEITHEFTDLDIQSIYTMDRVGDRLTFAEAYRKRWFECAQADPQGRYWLVNSRAIRTPLWKWAKDRGYWVEFQEGDVELQNVKLYV